MNTAPTKNVEPRPGSLEATRSDLCFIRPPRGRATQLSAEVQHAILYAVEKGTSLDTAAKMVGVSPNTVREWSRRGRGEDKRPAIEPYITFADQLEKTQASFEVQAVGAIYDAGQDGKWRAFAWLLERRHPNRWGRQRRQQRAQPRRRIALDNGARVPPPGVALLEAQERMLLEAQASASNDTPGPPSGMARIEWLGKQNRMLLEAKDST